MKFEEAYQFLERPAELGVKIRNKELEYERWNAMATSMTNGGKSVLVQVGGKMELQNMARVQSSGNPNKMTDAADRCIELADEIDAYKKELIEVEKEVLSVIELLPKVEYDVLHKLYILGWTPQQVMEWCDRSESWVSSTKGQGVKLVQDILIEKNY